MRVIGVENHAPVQALATERRPARGGGPAILPVEAKAVPARGAIDLSGLVELWTTSWQTALSALEAATRAGAMTTSEASAHRQRIIIEREVVTNELRELVDGSLVVGGLPGERPRSIQLARRERSETQADPGRRPHASVEGIGARRRSQPSIARASHVRALEAERGRRGHERAVPKRCSKGEYRRARG